jgi:hypothetical protein
MLSTRPSLVTLSRTHIIVSLAAALLFELAFFTGLFEENNPLRPLMFNSLYSVNLILILTAAILLFSFYWKSGNAVILLGALGIFSWLCGSFFWVSYVFLLGNVLTYPSIAELTFQGFHLLFIPVLLSIIKKSNFKGNPALVIIPLLCISVPFVISLFKELTLHNLLYSSFFLFLVSVNLSLSLIILYHKKYLLLLSGLFCIVYADISFVNVALFCPSCFVFMLDPFWFFGFSLISFSLLRYADRGELE